MAPFNLILSPLQVECLNTAPESIGPLRYIIKKSSGNILMFSAVTYSGEEKSVCQTLDYLKREGGGGGERLVLLAENLQDDNHITM